MKKILVAVDFSENSKKTIHFAIQYASQTNSELLFLYVLNIIAPTSEIIVDYNYYVQFQTEDLERKKTLLAKFVKTVYRKSGFQSTNYECICELGSEISTQIISVARQQNVDFICTGARGVSLLTKLFGSVASHLVTLSPIPVFVIPKNYRTKPITSICYASDMANLENEMQKVTDLASSLTANVNVLHFNYDLFLKENMKNLLDTAGKYENDTFTFHYKKLNALYPLNDHLRKAIVLLKPSLVVLFTKQDKNWFERLFLTSKSAEFSFTTKIPLLVYKKQI